MIPNGQSSHNLWATSTPISAFNDRHTTTNKVFISFECLMASAPLGGLLVDDMGLGKTMQAIALIGTSKEELINSPPFSTPTIIIFPPSLIIS
ncbi:hypothetical protein O181_044152 [Austropuccinia psidii MF-1]|uniref:SNF2 N-terminal domain-containing protein n=1 Tax=Austropuccinia psidii MF-1 TaxID=1389203 RepID=A0A9Q3DR86_9BASI|nr:hypothetical protein [Austropuccinia psidii MF-1]